MLLRFRQPPAQMWLGFGGDSLCFGATRKRKSANQQTRAGTTNRMTKICDINETAKQKLPPNSPDKSGIGVHYTDAFLKPMNTKLPDGTRVSCKRKGLKITLAVGTKNGEGVMRGLAVGQDAVVKLSAARQAEAG